jgi:hypothetical protein
VTARFISPSLGAASYQEQGKWSAAFSHRWQRSDRHFIGDEEQVIREKEGSQVINNIQVFDISASYVATERITVTLAIPFQLATRSQTIRDTRPGMTNKWGNQKVYDRYQTEANGLSDIRLLGTAWLLDPKQNPTKNISLGLGVVFPTGEKDAKDEVEIFDPNTPGFIRSESRNVDNSIQPGSGAWGILFDLYAFIEPITNFTVFVAGTYLSTPQEDAGVISGNLQTSTTVWSTGDSYLGRLGFGYTILPKQGLTFTLNGRVEGSPSHDLIGGSGGRRRPGFAVSIEPGLLFIKNGWTVSFSAPVAVYRNRTPDSTGQEGDAAFADFMTLFSVSKSL